MSAFSAVPVVDLEPLLKSLRAGETPLSEAALTVCIELHRCSQDIGFFYVSNHGVARDLRDTLAREAARFFALPEEEKRQLSMERGGRAWRGWFQLGGELTSGRPDQKEGYYFGAELPPDPRPMHGPNLFPDRQVPGLRGAVLQYMHECRQLAQAILRGLAVGLMGPQHADYFAERFSDHPTELFRIFRYPEHTFVADADEWGVREHTDYGFLTILLQDDSGGLEVRSWDGAWVAAPPIPDTFVVNLGDMMETFTRGRYRATPHRVRNQARHDRYSFPYFFDPNFDASLNPVPEELLAHHRKLQQRQRWDNADVENVAGKLTYGEYVVSKVLKVFPQLGDATAVAPLGASLY